MLFLRKHNICIGSNGLNGKINITRRPLRYLFDDLVTYCSTILYNVIRIGMLHRLESYRRKIDATVTTLRINCDNKKSLIVPTKRFF